MKFTFYALIIVCALFVASGCRKNSVDTSYYTYSLYGFQDTSLAFGESITMPLGIDYISGTSSILALSAPAAPPFVAVSFSPVNGIPPFVSNVTFTSNSNAASGYYTDGWGTFLITVRTTTDHSYDSSAAISLHILPTDATTYLAGTWSMAEQCAVDTTASVEIVKDSSAANKIIIKHFAHSNNNVTATIDPDAKTITIPGQTYNGVTYSGSGGFKLSNTIQSKITLLYTVTGGSVSGCQGTLTK